MISLTDDQRETLERIADRDNWETQEIAERILEAAD